MKYHHLLVFACLAMLFTQREANATIDSLRVITQSGKQFILHKVDAGETLYGLSRRYQTGVNAIIQANQLEANALKLGQELMIPLENMPAKVSEELPGTTSDFHVVREGETLYGISRKYDLSIDEIKALNGMTSNTLELGQRLKISNAAINEQPKPAPTTEMELTGSDTHTVSAGQTLFSIARDYGMTISEIKSLNGLSENTIAVGQKLRVKNEAGVEQVVAEPALATVEKSEPLPTVVTNVETSAPVVQTKTIVDTQLIEPIPKEKEEAPVQVAIATKDEATESPQVATKDEQATANTSITGEGFDKILEEGFAMKIENSPGSQKFLALHRTLPIGKILQVKNQMNNQSIYVRIIGKLPDTGINNNVLIRLSERAYERLGAIDPKIPVELTYLP